MKKEDEEIKPLFFESNATNFDKKSVENIRQKFLLDSN
jgi:hypothetical protein